MQTLEQTEGAQAPVPVNPIADKLRLRGVVLKDGNHTFFEYAVRNTHVTEYKPCALQNPPSLKAVIERYGEDFVMHAVQAKLVDEARKSAWTSQGNVTCVAWNHVSPSDSENPFILDKVQTLFDSAKPKQTPSATIRKLIELRVLSEAEGQEALKRLGA